MEKVYYKKLSLEIIDDVLAELESKQSDRRFVLGIYGKNSLTGLKAFDNVLTKSLKEYGK